MSPRLQVAVDSGRDALVILLGVNQVDGQDRTDALLAAAKLFRAALVITGEALNEHRQRERRKERKRK